MQRTPFTVLAKTIVSFKSINIVILKYAQALNGPLITFFGMALYTDVQTYLKWTIAT